MNKHIINIIFVWLMLVFIQQSYSQTISIMSFNIRYDNPNDAENSWDNRKNELVNLIEYYHPDFLGIQEGLLNQVEFIKNNCSNYSMIGVGREDGDKKGEFVAVYYDTVKYELIEQNTFWLSENTDTVSVGWDAALERICTYGKFIDRQTSELIHIFNTHFDHKGIKAQEMSANLILMKISERNLENSQVIVMGDLNCEPQSEPIRILKTKLIDGIEVSEKKFYGPEGSFNGFDTELIIDRRIDYIFIKNLIVNYYQHIDDKRLNNYWISDHLPILIELRRKTVDKD